VVHVARERWGPVGVVIDVVGDGGQFGAEFGRCLGLVGGGERDEQPVVDLGVEPGVPASWWWISPARLRRPSCRLGGRPAMLCQHAADRLDSEPGLVLADEPHEACCGRSSSAKMAAGALRISLARRSCRSLRSSADSSLLTPAAAASTSA